MWPCPKCREDVVDDFDVCWNCGTTRDGVEDPGFQKAEDAPPMDDAVEAEDITVIRPEPEPVTSKHTRATSLPLHCPRCHTDTKFVGTKSFHEGFSWGGFGDLAEFFVNKENFDVYVCPRCGRVEFYVSGIGDERRPREVEE
jgi:hypothetical protein